MSDKPLLKLTLTKDNSIKPIKPFRISFKFQTDVGEFRFKAGDTIEEIKELLPIGIMDAGHVYNMTKTIKEYLENEHAR